MEKTYSQLLVVIARKDLELARIREKIERENREYNEVYREALESHKRDLETVATEYQNSLAELSGQVTYWQDSTATARKERDKLYGEVSLWQQEYRTIRQCNQEKSETIDRLRVERDNLATEKLGLQAQLDNLRESYKVLQSDFKIYVARESTPETSPETSPEPSPESIEQCPMLEWLNSEENPFN